MSELGKKRIRLNTIIIINKKIYSKEKRYIIISTKKEPENYEIELELELMW